MTITPKPPFIPEDQKTAALAEKETSPLIQPSAKSALSGRKVKLIVAGVLTAGLAVGIYLIAVKVRRYAINTIILPSRSDKKLESSDFYEVIEQINSDFLKEEVVKRNFISSRSDREELNKMFGKTFVDRVFAKKDQILSEGRKGFSAEQTLRQAVLECLKKPSFTALNKGELTTEDGVKLDGGVIEHFSQKELPPGKQKWVVYFMSKDDRYEKELGNLKDLPDITGANVLVFNYRGVGKSEDAKRGMFADYLTEEELIADGEATVKYLTDMGVKTEHIMLQGHSQGGAVAAQVATRHQEPGKEMHLCIDRSFTSYADATRELVSTGLGKTIGKMAAALASSWWKFDTERALAKIKGHVIILHDSKDTVVQGTAQLGRKLSEQPQHPKRELINLAPLKREEGASLSFLYRQFILSLEGQKAHTAPLIRDDEEGQLAPHVAEFSRAAKTALAVEQTFSSLLQP